MIKNYFHLQKLKRFIVNIFQLMWVKKFTKRDMLITILPHKYNEMSFISNIYFRSANKIYQIFNSLWSNICECRISRNRLYVSKQYIEYVTLLYKFNIQLLFRLTIKTSTDYTTNPYSYVLREVRTLHQLMSKTANFSLVSILGFLYI